MPLITGARIGPYEITGTLGAGGMGEVYRARDTKLNREVALKVLPDAVTREPERLARFKREAQVLASLNHPHIGAIYGFEDSSETHALVLELVEGETLAERITRGPLPLDDALPIARALADALEAAHEQGIIHRDLKPANIKITPGGTVKVLDFGLAKAIEEAAPTPNSLSPTLSIMATNAGVILGTAGYMSPEQARGHATDQRSDIFSFACVFYEMLTGRRAFPGDTITDVIALIVARDPDWRALPPNLHPKTEELIRRCLAKNRKDRWHAIGDVRVELETIMADPHGLKSPTPREASRQPLWRRALLPAAMGVSGALIAVAGTLAFLDTRSLPPPAITRFPLALSEGQRIPNTQWVAIAMSPDGSNIVYLTNEQMHIRNMGEMEARPVQKTSPNDRVPFFSPDGQWVGYYSATDRSLKKVALAGGAAVTICEAGCDDSSFGFVWSSDDYIYMGRTKAIVRVSANGGKPEQVITLKDNETAYRPQLLPGGGDMLFTLQTGGNSMTQSWDTAQIVVQSLTSNERTVLIRGGSDGRYVPSGHLVYSVGTTLFAMAFDVQTRQVTGARIPIVDDVQRGLGVGLGGAAAQFAFSDTGSFAYIPRGVTARNAFALALVDRDGGRTDLKIEPGPYSNPRISPDGRQLVLQVGDDQDRAIFVADLKGVQPIRKLTFEGKSEKPLWTRDRDRQRVVFTSDREGDSSLFWQWVDGGPAERFAKIQGEIRPQAESWLPEGNVLLFSNRSGAGTVGGGLYRVSPGADQQPKLIIDAPAGNSSLSPDGRWLAHSWFESGRVEVYVQPFPPTGEKHLITRDGGSSPLWSPDGRQLFFLRPNAATQQLVAVDVRTERGFVAEKITPLPIEGIVTTGPRSYDITPDGKHFLVMVPTSPTEARPALRDQINITLNWFEELKRLAPAQ